MNTTHRSLVLALVLSPLGVGTAAGQGWTLDVSGGRVAYDLAASIPGRSTAIVGVRYHEPEVGWLYVSSGLPIDAEDSTWGAAGLGRRLIRRESSVDVGLDAGVHGYLYRDPAFSSTGSGAGLELRPLVAVGRGSVRLEARSGWVGNRSNFEGAERRRGVHDSDARINVVLNRSARISSLVRHVRADEGSYTYGEGQLTVGLGRVTAWGSLGTWTSDALPTTPWGTGVSAVLDDSGRTRVGVAFRQDASDPIYWNSARRRWSVGVSHTLGGRSRVASAPAPELSIPPLDPTPGRVTIRIPISGSEGDAPSIAGDFTQWKPTRMVKDGDYWSMVFELGRGIYRYSFRSPSGDWYVPKSVASRRPDGMGGFVATLVVAGDR